MEGTLVNNRVYQPFNIKPIITQIVYKNVEASTCCVITRIVIVLKWYTVCEFFRCSSLRY
jgi:hypothetical protein